MTEATEQPGRDPAARSGISYEAARDELLDVVRQLESGGVPLERSLALWERGEELADVCQAWLDGARQRLAARHPAGEDPNGDAPPPAADGR
jgi:exodeoxyribonuclease VII small subunit